MLQFCHSTVIKISRHLDDIYVIEKFDTFFKVRKNFIFERARFNQRCQTEGESVEQFITTVYSLAENCEFGVLTDELIRDRIVVGISDNALSE